MYFRDDLLPMILLIFFNSVNLFNMKTNKGKFQISKAEHFGCAPRLKGVVKNLGIKPTRKMKRKGEVHMRVSDIKKKLK